MLSAVFGNPFCPFPETNVSETAGSAVAVAWKTADEDIPVTEAVTSWLPAVVPSVQVVETRPSLPVVGFAVPTLPPPVDAANVTDTPAMALPDWSFT